MVAANPESIPGVRCLFTFVRCVYVCVCVYVCARAYVHDRVYACV
jgi:hypothetical protein